MRVIPYGRTRWSSELDKDKLLVEPLSATQHFTSLGIQSALCASMQQIEKLTPLYGSGLRVVGDV